MKFLITGGNRGLGLVLCDRLQGDSISRANGFDITQDEDKIARYSLAYDVFVNNAFDGPFHEAWADFGQVKVLHAVASAWQQAGKSGLIINIGSIGTETVVAPDPSFETYRVSKAALKHHSLQWTQAFKQNKARFRTTLLTLDRLDTPLSRGRESWTGNGIDTDELADWINLLSCGKPNTCVGEICAWVNFHHKH